MKSMGQPSNPEIISQLFSGKAPWLRRQARGHQEQTRARRRRRFPLGCGEELAQAVR